MFSHCSVVMQHLNFACFFWSKTYFVQKKKNKLTHLLGQQVNILFVASVWGIVQLYQGQSLSKDISVTPIQTKTCSDIFPRNKVRDILNIYRQEMICHYLGSGCDGEHERGHSGAAEIQQAALQRTAEQS